jgi:pyruvate/2-oxoglutarate dehydrogenase complex dihydrolipoamide dehydrogenase (E3) component
MLGRIQVAFATTTGMETVDGSHLLLTTGRHPNIDGLDLATAGIGTAAGRIVVDKYLRSTNKRVYAVGAVAGGPDSTHVSHYHAGLVIRQLMLGMPAKLNRLSIPWVLFTDPELAHVGMLEDEARAHAGIIRVLRWPYRENDRAQVEQSTDGHIKVITDRRGDILGVTIAGSRASESINAWTLAINQKLNIRALAGLVVPYPSYAEVGKRAAISFFRSGLTTPRTRRIMGWLRRLR